jgi:ferritin-like metal-binding protein YciE
MKRVAKRGAARKSPAKKAAAKSAAKRSSARGSRTAKRPAARKGSRRAARQPEKDLKELFHETLKDVYHAEKQLVRALPKMARAAQSSELKQAFQTHLEETQSQVERLERVFEILGERAQTKPCHGMMGLVEEGEEAIKEFKGTEPGDAALIGAAQAVEHYEIARYGTLQAWASELGMEDAARLLEETLGEEKHADELLTEIAESAANAKAEGETEGEFGFGGARRAA